jgi:hypothetical protein
MPIKKEVVSFFNFPGEEIKKIVQDEFKKAFCKIEVEDKCITDVVISRDIFLIVSQYLEDFKNNKNIRFILRGIYGELWGARVWIRETADGIYCYHKNSKELGKKFSDIAIAKKELKIKD